MYYAMFAKGARATRCACSVRAAALLGTLLSACAAAAQLLHAALVYLPAFALNVDHVAPPSFSSAAAPSAPRGEQAQHRGGGLSDGQVSSPQTDTPQPPPPGRAVTLPLSSHHLRPSCCLQTYIDHPLDPIATPSRVGVCCSVGFLSRRINELMPIVLDRCADDLVLRKKLYEVRPKHAQSTPPKARRGDSCSTGLLALGRPAGFAAMVQVLRAFSLKQPVVSHSMVPIE